MSDPDRIKDLLNRALDLPATERDSFVRAEAGGDASLIAAVQSQLEQHDIETIQATPRTTGNREPSPSDRIGPYKVLGVLGEGGFGVVYEAEQSAPVRRRVALKIIKAGMDSKSVVARFEAERQALAVMDHPCIAKVFDGGVTDPAQGSRPFFVMELVKGESITDFCDRERLTIDERCNLFIHVCDAVQHAHMKGVVHRDLKPSNVLVSRDADGKASPKVIDFGVAKALSQQLTAKTIFTERGQLIGTPEYMSPEQAEMSGQDIDTRSDVYSLGVLLYELLTGVLPFDSKSLREAGYAEIQRIIRDQSPPKPSTRLSTAGEADVTQVHRIVSARRSELRSMTGELKRDLDWVILKCLEKERDRRYETAKGLGEELQRYINGEALVARPPTARYRVAKLVSRHRKQIGLAAVVLIAVMLGLIGLALGSMKSADAAIRVAESRAAQVESAAVSLSYMLEVSSQGWQIERNRRNEGQLAGMWDLVLEVFPEDSEAQLEAAAVLSRALQERGDRFAQAELDWAATLERERLGEASPAEILAAMGPIALNFQKAGRPALAAEAMQAVAERAGRAGDGIESVKWYRRAATQWMAADRPSRGIETAETGFRLAQDVFERGERGRMVMASAYAGALSRMDRLDEAFELWNRENKDLETSTSKESAGQLEQLARLHKERGDFAESDRVYGIVIGMYESLQGYQYDTLRIRRERCLLWLDMDRAAEALPEIESVTAQFATITGENDFQHLWARRTLAKTRLAMGLYPLVTRELPSIIVRMQSFYGENDPGTIESVEILAEALRQEGQYAASAVLLELSIGLIQSRDSATTERRYLIINNERLLRVYREWAEDEGDPEFNAAKIVAIEAELEHLKR